MINSMVGFRQWLAKHQKRALSEALEKVKSGESGMLAFLTNPQLLTKFFFSFSTLILIILLIKIIIHLRHNRNNYCYYYYYSYYHSFTDAIVSLDCLRDAELMLLGFISLLLTIGQGPISNICVSEKVANSFLPCRKNSSSGSSSPDGDSSRRKLLQFAYSDPSYRRILAGGSSDKCVEKARPFPFNFFRCFFVILIFCHRYHHIYHHLLFLLIFHLLFLLLYSMIMMMMMMMITVTIFCYHFRHDRLFHRKHLLITKRPPYYVIVFISSIPSSPPPMDVIFFVLTRFFIIVIIFMVTWSLFFFILLLLLIVLLLLRHADVI